MHTWIKTVNGYKINHWTLGDFYYLYSPKTKEWIFKSKNVDEVEKHALTLEPYYANRLYEN